MSEQQQQIRLVLKDTEIVRLSQYPGENGDTQILGVRALLTRPLAQQLKCHDNCFAENGMPRRYVDLTLTGLVIEQCEVDLDGQVILAHQVQSFKIGRPKKKSETDASLELTCNLHFTYSPWLADWAHRKNKAQFQTAVTPPPSWDAQASLFEKADPDVQDEAEGEEDAPAPQVVEVKAEDGQEPTSDHLKGEALEQHQAAEQASKTPTLASAREVTGRRRRRPEGSGGVVEIGIADSAPAGTVN